MVDRRPDAVPANEVLVDWHDPGEDTVRPRRFAEHDLG